MSSLYSSTIFWRSRPVNRCRRMSRIASACGWVKAKFAIRRSLASAGLALWRMVVITSSR